VLEEASAEIKLFGTYPSASPGFAAAPPAAAPPPPHSWGGVVLEEASAEIKLRDVPFGLARGSLRPLRPASPDTSPLRGEE